jgi:diaminohydroxyphosphoribosylaminopyrimidine deaminase/5-amino-6-(5-phosphoribosylamino)uracil reductase
VVTAMEDPNPAVSNGGISSLRNAGINVDVGIMREQAERLNRGFVRRMRQQRPWVTLKLAASMDGRTAMASGESKWITSEASRVDVQRLRASSSAVMTGIGTVLADDPALTVRLEGFDRQPTRVIVDSRLTIDANARVMMQPGEVLIYTAIEHRAQADHLRQAGVDVVHLPGPQDRVDLDAMMEDLAARGVNELLVEAGRTLSGTLIGRNLVDELILYLAPHILGDVARGMFRLPGIERLSDRLEFTIADVRRVGPDLRLILCP